MKNNKKIIRNKSVFCAKSKLRNEGFLDSPRMYQEAEEATRAQVLSDVCEEQENYQTLLYYYKDALQGNDNNFFLHAYVWDKNHAIRIDKEQKIILYFYQDKIRIGRRSVFPWEYPHLITCIGTVDNNTDISSVLFDLKNISMLDFFLKYYIHSEKRELNIHSTSNGYLVNDFLKIIINEHITFQWMDSSQIHRDKYIADSWWFTNEEIIEAMTHMSFLEFGKEYLAFWGR